MAQRQARNRASRVWKFASCDGCQLSLLDCEDELLAVAGAVDIAYFPEATRGRIDGPLRPVAGRRLDHHAARRRAHPGRARARRARWSPSAPAPPPAASRRCAISPTSRNSPRVVYARPDYIETLATSTPIADHVPVDFELRGCPINKHQLLEVITAFLAGASRQTPAHSVCIECKLKGNVCVMVAHGTPCLGPVTHAGCGALCPVLRPRLLWLLRTDGNAQRARRSAPRCPLPAWTKRTRKRIYRTFNANAPAFREESERHDT